MKPTVRLRVLQARDAMLFAACWPAAWMPWLLGGALAVWLGCVWLLARRGMEPAALLGALAALALAIVSPALPLQGSVLTIDRPRGWVHWQQRRWPHRTNRESFSPQRIEILKLERRGWPALGLGCREIVLTLDHPRLARVGLGRAWSANAARRRIRQLSRHLRIDWQDEQGLLHLCEAEVHPAVKDDAPSWHGMEWLEQLAPPPEIRLCHRHDRTCIILPNLSGLHGGPNMFLVYGIVWCLWAMTSLTVQLAEAGPAANWTSAQTGRIALLLGGSLAGLVMLGPAVVWAVGREELGPRGECWMLRRRWWILSWGAKKIRIQRFGAIRRVDPPGEEAGLWLSDGSGDIRLGAGLSSDALGWLQQVLQRGNRPSPATAAAPATVPAAIGVEPDLDGGA
jgi:hypothetical protein